jgi:hypothetical protein
MILTFISLNTFCQKSTNDNWFVSSEITSVIFKDQSANIQVGYKKKKNQYYVGISKVSVYDRNSAGLFNVSSLLSGSGSVYTDEVQPTVYRNLNLKIGYRKKYSSNRITPALGGGFLYSNIKEKDFGKPFSSLNSFESKYWGNKISHSQYTIFNEFGLYYRLNKHFNILLSNTINFNLNQKKIDAYKEKVDKNNVDFFSITDLHLERTTNYSINSNYLQIFFIYNF